MTDLLSDLYAEIDRRETNARAAIDAVGEAPWRADVGLEPWSVETGPERSRDYVVEGVLEEVGDHIADNDPSHVLRGLAEDRDILTRHRPVQELSETLGPNPRPEYLTLCAHEWDHGEGRLVLWKHCPDVRSLARRLNVEVPS